MAPMQLCPDLWRKRSMIYKFKTASHMMLIKVDQCELSFPRLKCMPHVACTDILQVPETDRHVHRQLVLNKGTKAIQRGKTSLCNKSCWNHWENTGKNTNLDLYFTQYTKSNLRWITDQSIKAKTIRLLKENTENIHSLGDADYLGNQKYRGKVWLIRLTSTLKPSVHEKTFLRKWKVSHRLGEYICITNFWQKNFYPEYIYI